MTVVELLAKQAAEQRELSRQRATEATEAKPLVEQAATLMTSSRKAVEALQEQLAEIEAALAEARQAHDHATDAHAEALAVVAEHEAEAQQAADIAESLDRIAKQMRDARPEPPHEALAATGLMVEPPKVVDLVIADGRVAGQCAGCSTALVWVGDYDKQVHVTNGEPWCEDAEPADDSPFTAVPADPGIAARVAAHLPVATPPVPDEPVATSGPGVTMPDLGPARPPLDPPPGEGTHSHARPGALSRLTGGWPVVGRRKHDEQDGDRTDG